MRADGWSQSAYLTTTKIRVKIDICTNSITWLPSEVCREADEGLSLQRYHSIKPQGKKRHSRRQRYILQTGLHLDLVKIVTHGQYMSKLEINAALHVPLACYRGNEHGWQILRSHDPPKSQRMCITWARLVRRDYLWNVWNRFCAF